LTAKTSSKLPHKTGSNPK